MISKFMETLDKGITTVSAKSEIMLEIKRLKTESNRLRREISTAKVGLGQTVYSGWCQGETDQNTVEEVCTAIQDLERQLEALQLRMDQLKLEEENRRRPLTGTYCPKCGSANPPDSNFCGSCGEKLIH